MTPERLAHSHFDTLLSELPAAFNGSVEGIHQARVATRRLREVLPLVDAPASVTESVKSAGRQLGHARELDVMGDLLDSLGRRLPTAAAAELYAARQAVRERQQAARRAMVKALEKLDVPAVRRTFDKQASKTAWSLPPLFAAAWAAPIWTRIAQRSRAAVAAVEQAPGTYFPNRMHRARVAVKKLRYAVELAGSTGVWRQERVLKDLRRLQALLGDQHDAHVLADALDDLLGAPQPTTTATSFVKAALAGDLARYQVQYLRWRDRIPAIAAASECAAARARHRWRVPGPLVAASLFTAPMALVSVRHTLASRRHG
jgi:CHAD domain-containing protein